MIVSASRRTDIPAFFSEWLLNRLRAEFCLVPNPFNAKQLTRVSLRAEDVEAFVFWSKNPAPMLKLLPVLDDLGHRYYFQFTLNDYDETLEPHVPPLEKRLGTFTRLVEVLGPRRVIWRYDPIILSNRTPPEFHEATFRRLALRLKGLTTRAVISVVDFYRKTDQRLARLEQEGLHCARAPEEKPETHALLKTLKWIADDAGIEIQTCSETSFKETGIACGRCIDAELIHSIWGREASGKKDPGQRAACGCAISRDIGIADTCLHGCQYCYATRNNELSRRRRKDHDPLSPMLLGHPLPEQIVEQQPRQADLFGGN